MKNLITLLSAQKKTVFAAESCTAGLFTALLASIPGASEVLLGGVVCYDNSIKEKLLGVKPQTLEQDGAVSFACCGEMLRGALGVSGADYSCAVTGIAGPGGGSPQKPVGTVYIGVLGKGGGIINRFLLEGGREEVRRQSAEITALMLSALVQNKNFSHPRIQEQKKAPLMGG